MDQEPAMGLVADEPDLQSDLFAEIWQGLEPILGTGAVGASLGSAGGPAGAGAGGVIGLLVGLVAHLRGQRSGGAAPAQAMGAMAGPEGALAALWRQALARRQASKGLAAGGLRLAGATPDGLEALSERLADVFQRLAEGDEELGRGLAEVRRDIVLSVRASLGRALAVINVQNELLSALSAGPVGTQSLEDWLSASVPPTDPQHDWRVSPQLLRPTGPNWADLEAGVPFQRADGGLVVGQLVDSTAPRRVVLLLGTSASGKTVLARQIGFRLLCRGPVLCADAETLLRRAGSVRDVLASLAAALGSSGDVAVRPLFLLEDLHQLGRDGALDLFEELSRLIASADFLLTSRPITGRGDDGDVLENAVAASATASLVDLRQGGTASGDHRALATHMWRKRWELCGQPAPFEVASHADRLVREADGNLWLLTWMVAGHSGHPAEEFSRRIGLDEAGLYLHGGGGYGGVATRCSLTGLADRMRGKPLIPAMVLAASGFSQWEVGVSRYFLAALLAAGEPDVTRQEMLEAITALESTGEFCPEPDDEVRLPHSALADVYLQAHEAEDGAGTVHYLGGRIAAFQRDRGIRVERSERGTGVPGPATQAALLAAHLVWCREEETTGAIRHLARRSSPWVKRWPVKLTMAPGVRYVVRAVIQEGVPEPAPPREPNTVEVPLGAAVFWTQSPLKGHGADELGCAVDGSQRVHDALLWCVERLLAGEDEYGAVGACVLLGLAYTRPSAELLTYALAKHGSRQVRFSAGVMLLALCRWLHPSRRPPESTAVALQHGLSDEEPAVAAVCACALKHVPGATTEQALLSCLEREGDEWPRAEAALSLADLGCTAAIPVLETFADAPFSTPTLWFHTTGALEALRGRRASGS